MNRFSRDANQTTEQTPPFGATDTSPSAEPLHGAWAGSSPDEARRLLEEVQLLGSRMRNNRRRAQQIDRRAAAYASRLARHTARLLQHMPDAIPAIRPVAGTGASTLRHYVLKHDLLEAPDRMRLLVVSSDGRLRICTALTDGKRSRLWNDYEVANPPAGLGLSVVFEGLSSLIVQLESAVGKTEQQSDDHALDVDGLIADSEAKLSKAGSRLSPVDPLPDDDNDDWHSNDVMPPEGDLKSHGFEHRISFGGMRESAAPAASATTPASPARGRFQR
ncbi:MAG: hypothetical protein H7Z40_12140 [Phycisphaerae bacterium]|nr:hypothetical protein [Gemmatimonadaceae bacterium]